MHENNLSNSFPTGTYIVLICPCSLPQACKIEKAGEYTHSWDRTFPTSVVYRLSEPSNSRTFLVEKDWVGDEKNGWSISSNTYLKKTSSFLRRLKMRVATPYEITKYKEANRPVLREDFYYYNKMHFLLGILGYKVPLEDQIEEGFINRETP